MSIYVAPHLQNVKTEQTLKPEEMKTVMEDEFIVITNSSYAPLESLADISCGKCLPFSKPTPIQRHSIPVLRHGHDLIVRAPTGMGKTLCFLLPLVERIRYNGIGTQVLVITPTRELADQIKTEAEKVVASKRLKVAVVYGGFKRGLQSYKGIDLIVATPGRLLDCLESGKIVLNGLKSLVLDEADKLLDMGFEPVIRNIKKYVKTGAQVCLFSATYSKELTGIINDFLPRERFSVEIKNETLSTIKQEVILVQDKSKDQALLEEFGKLNLSSKWRRGDDEMADKVIVFVEQKSTARDLEKRLNAQGVVCGSIHGDKEQQERTAVLNKFRTGTLPVLVATSVAARGIDVDDVKLVVNYDFPRDSKEYIHRIGRTGRKGKEGKAVAFITPTATPATVNELISVLKESKNEVPSFLLNWKSRPTKGRGYEGAGSFGFEARIKPGSWTETRADRVSKEFKLDGIPEKLDAKEKEDSDDDLPGQW